MAIGATTPPPQKRHPYQFRDRPSTVRAVTLTIHHVDFMCLDELMEGLRALIIRVRAGRLRGSDLTDATIIMNNYLPNLGVLIVRARAGIIRQLIAQPEVAIASAKRDSDR